MKFWSYTKIDNNSRTSSDVIAVLTSAIVFLFIPWSLPTLSYNTIGMLGMLMALCLFALVVLDLDKKTRLWSLLGSCSCFF